ncbi:MAG: FHA domain-containing protein [Candidatus Dadabacteria bacterium]|nr:MAG: FHA domain-containing protein [Candidatus Dadabacteria bacterium]
MFAVKFDFPELDNLSETVLVRRPHVVIGGGSYAHVSVADMKERPYSIVLLKDIGERFVVKVNAEKETLNVPAIDGRYQRSAYLPLESIILTAVSLDVDLAVESNESLDEAAVRILRRALTTKSPDFPAVVIRGGEPVIISIPANYKALVGRSGDCHIRIDVADVSSKHAAVTYEDGRFWIEDLGSTNGTFVNGEQVSGKREVAPMTPIRLGQESIIICVRNEEELGASLQKAKEEITSFVPPQKDKALAEYPALVSVSEIARPARVVLEKGKEIIIGRHPTCDIWIGAPHISRKHCTVTLMDDNTVLIKDFSTNGTAYYGGILHKGDELKGVKSPLVLNFGSGITAALCFNKEDEKRFVANQGSFYTFAAPKRQEKMTEENKAWEDATMQLSPAEQSLIKESITEESLGKLVPKPDSFASSREKKIKLLILIAIGLGIAVLIVWAIILFPIFLGSS